MDVLVTYDISTVDLDGPKRLARIAAVCERYGQRVQYSVFECRLDGILLERMISELTESMDPRADSIHIYRLGASLDSSRQSLGRSGIDWTRRWVL